MEVFLRKDVPKIGLEGEIIKVGDGFARNFLIPQGLAVEITEQNKAQFLSKIRKVQNRKEVLATETSMLADKIASLEVTLKRKMHDDGKLYGAITALEIVEALASKGISISKNQIDFDKTIKEKGTYNVTVKLTTRLKPKISVKVISE